MPRFSILIPTRNRPDTLRASLRTCLAQDFDDYEVIVSNNSDVLSEETRSVVADTQSPKIRHIQPEQPLSMTDNWEFALSHATGEYVLVFGDDDGLTLFALKELDRLIELTDAAVVSWAYAYYMWPNMPTQFAHRINFPLSQNAGWRKGRSTITKVSKFKDHYFALPMLYNSAVSRALLSRISQRTGRFFFSQCPDIYSGFAIACSVDKYVRSDIPITISGTSAKSNGYAGLFGGHTDIASDFRSLNRRDGVSPHPTTPSTLLLSACVNDSFNFAKDNLFPHDRSLRMNDRDLLLACLRDVSGLPSEKANQALADLSVSFAGNRRLKSKIEKARASLCVENKNYPQRPIRLTAKTYYDGGQFLLLDGESFNVSDIYDASVLLENIFGYRLNGIDWQQLLSLHSTKQQLKLLPRRFRSRVRRLIHRYV